MSSGVFADFRNGTMFGWSVAPPPGFGGSDATRFGGQGGEKVLTATIDSAKAAGPCKRLPCCLAQFVQQLVIAQLAHRSAPVAAWPA
jgi:hypothetical protein